MRCRSAAVPGICRTSSARLENDDASRTTSTSSSSLIRRGCIRRNPLGRVSYQDQVLMFREIPVHKGTRCRYDVRSISGHAFTPCQERTTSIGFLQSGHHLTDLHRVGPTSLRSCNEVFPHTDREGPKRGRIAIVYCLRNSRAVTMRSGVQPGELQNCTITRNRRLGLLSPTSAQ